MAKKCKLLVIFISVAAGCLWFIHAAITPSLPTSSSPIVFYSNQMRDDFRQTLITALKNGRHSIHVTMYAITDPKVVKILEQKAKNGVEVKVFYDPSATPISFLPPIEAFPVKGKGLMHRKIVVIDHESVFLGSANLTTSSLMLHSNLSVGFHDKTLAEFLENQSSEMFSFSQGRVFLLPQKKALEELKSTIENAKKKIHIAMFTLTHPDLVEALIQAQKRGVAVTIALDYYTGRGASAKAAKKLKEAGIKIFLSQGSELLHHKWAAIDDLLVLGSTNWTKAAFERNRDILLFLPHLDASKQQYLKKLWDIILCESTQI